MHFEQYREIKKNEELVKDMKKKLVQMKKTSDRINDVYNTINTTIYDYHVNDLVDIYLRKTCDALRYIRSIPKINYCYDYAQEDYDCAQNTIDKIKEVSQLIECYEILMFVNCDDLSSYVKKRRFDCNTIIMQKYEEFTKYRSYLLWLTTW